MGRCRSHEAEIHECADEGDERDGPSAPLERWLETVVAAKLSGVRFELCQACPHFLLEFSAGFALLDGLDNVFATRL